jgi:hypothetical protein
MVMGYGVSLADFVRAFFAFDLISDLEISLFWLAATKDRVIVAILLERCEKPDQQNENVENDTRHFLDCGFPYFGPSGLGERREID